MQPILNSLSLIQYVVLSPTHCPPLNLLKTVECYLFLVDYPSPKLNSNTHVQQPKTCEEIVHSIIEALSLCVWELVTSILVVQLLIFHRHRHIEPRGDDCGEKLTYSVPKGKDDLASIFVRYFINTKLTIRCQGRSGDRGLTPFHPLAQVTEPQP